MLPFINIVKFFTIKVKRKGKPFKASLSLSLPLEPAEVSDPRRYPDVCFLDLHKLVQSLA